MIQIFHYTVKIGKSLNKTILNMLFASHDSEEIKLANKSNHNKRKNKVILLMIDDGANNLLFCCKKTCQNYILLNG